MLSGLTLSSEMLLVLGLTTFTLVMFTLECRNNAAAAQELKNVAASLQAAVAYFKV